MTGLPVVVKGVLRPDDARRCVEAGAAAVWVSNHGGRQLDQAAATADCLARASWPRWPTPARCTSTGECAPAGTPSPRSRWGARAVFLGRPPVYALAADGPAGVTRLLDELDEELAETLRLAGCRSVGRDTDLLSGTPTAPPAVE